MLFFEIRYKFEKYSKTWWNQNRFGNKSKRQSREKIWKKQKTSFLAQEMVIFCNRVPPTCKSSDYSWRSIGCTQFGIVILTWYYLLWLINRLKAIILRKFAKNTQFCNLSNAINTPLKSHLNPFKNCHFLNIRMRR